MLLRNIMEYQNRGRLTEALQYVIRNEIKHHLLYRYQKLLHRNLVHLATISDNAQTIEVINDNVSPINVNRMSIALS
jgi:hypothetical protein